MYSCVFICAHVHHYSVDVIIHVCSFNDHNKGYHTHILINTSMNISYIYAVLKRVDKSVSEVCV